MFNRFRAGLLTPFKDGLLFDDFRQTYHAYACIGLFLVSGIHRGREQRKNFAVE